jgi:bla regulator protein BlaR1
MVTAGVWAQAPPSQKFEVASIKPSDPDLPGMRIQTRPGGRYSASGITVKVLIQNAYGVRDFQISGGPGWINTAGFEINAKAESGTENDRDLMALRLQDLLADRFQLKLTKETREMPVYALVVAKGGSKLKESALDEEHRGGMSMGRGRLTVQGINVASIVAQLSSVLGRTVIDKTGLTGSYDFKLEWTPESEASSTNETSGPTIFTALQESLGLKLESTKGPVEMLVINSVERPAEN